MDDSVLSVQHLHKTYGKLVAVEDISFDVRRGEIFGLLGPNGAGKTTSLECLEGLRAPDGGTMLVAGLDPRRQFRQLRDVLGVQLQTTSLPPTIRVAEALELFCAYHRVKPPTDLLDRLDLTAKRAAQYQELSGGQQRRLALALAVAHNPQVLFLDEPTAALDVPSRVTLHELLRELQRQGTAILLATHDMAEAEALANRIAILLHGRVVATGTPLEITATGAGLSKISVRTEGGCLVDPAVSFPATEHRQWKDDYALFYSCDIGPTVGAMIDYVEAHGDKLIDLRIERPSLEDRFLEIMHTGVAV